MISDELMSEINDLEDYQKLYVYGYLEGVLKYLENGKWK